MQETPNQSKKPRALLIAEACDPDGASVPLVGWSHANALRELVDAHLLTHPRTRDAIVARGLVEGRDFTLIDNEHVARPLFRLANALRGGDGKGWTTVAAVTWPSYWEFERLVWKQFGAKIQAGDFDIVHRITPLSPTVPSRLATRCKQAGVPFVLGPLNGGVRWPQGYGDRRRAEKEWLSYVRGAYRLLPGYRSTCRDASAFVIGSEDTLRSIDARCRDRCVYVPENGVEPERFTKRRSRRACCPPCRRRRPGGRRGRLRSRRRRGRGLLVVDERLDQSREVGAVDHLAVGRVVQRVEVGVVRVREPAADRDAADR